MSNETFQFLQLKYVFVEKSNAIGRFIKFQFQFAIFYVWKKSQHFYTYTNMYGFRNKNTVFARVRRRGWTKLIRLIFIVERKKNCKMDIYLKKDKNDQGLRHEFLL